MKSLIALAVVLMTVVLLVGYYAHRDDERLKAECEANGGTFIEARDPLHVCVKEVK